MQQSTGKIMLNPNWISGTKELYVVHVHVVHVLFVHCMFLPFWLMWQGCLLTSLSMGYCDSFIKILLSFEADASALCSLAIL